MLRLATPNQTDPPCGKDPDADEYLGRYETDAISDDDIADDPRHGHWQEAQHRLDRVEHLDLLEE